MRKKRIGNNEKRSQAKSSLPNFGAPSATELGFGPFHPKSEKNPELRERAILEQLISLGGNIPDNQSIKNRSLLPQETPDERLKKIEAEQKELERKEAENQRLKKEEQELRLDPEFVREQNDCVTRSVRDQYELFPYPVRKPENDQKFLLLTPLDNLMLVNQSCYSGKKDFSNRFRVLVAGGGTGDALVYLAVQLARVPHAEIHYIDLSAESMRIAQERLHNQAVRLDCPQIEEIVNFRVASILDLPSLGIGEFDYINCYGVLHHLNDPFEGIRSLRAVLKDDGAMGLMLYGKVGRTSIYPMQDLMRIINRGFGDPDEQIRNTNLILSNLPLCNPHRRNGRWPADEGNPNEIYDTFLHSRDRAFDIDEIFDLAENVGLHINGFGSGLTTYLDPGAIAYTLPSRIRKVVEKMSVRELLRFFELHHGHFNKYELYLSLREDAAIEMENGTIIPSFTVFARIQQLQERLRKADRGEQVAFNTETHFGESLCAITVDELLKKICANIDDRSSIDSIVESLRPSLANIPANLVRGIVLQRLEVLIQRNMISFRHPGSNVEYLNRENF